jgi:hypothetical protein
MLVGVGVAVDGDDSRAGLNAVAAAGKRLRGNTGRQRRGPVFGYAHRSGSASQSGVTPRKRYRCVATHR